MRLLGRRRGRSGFRLTDRATVALGALAAGSSLAAIGIEIRRVWRRGSAPYPAGEGNLLLAAEEAVAETVDTLVTGYREGSMRENAMFNLLASFVASLVLARGIAYQLRSRRAFGPFRDFHVGRRHIHHFVPGIVLTFVTGAVALVVHDERLQRWLAIPFGAGMGLVLDESALLLELDDVYWTEEGVVGLQIALGVTALLAALAIGLRFTRRGERLVLPPTPPTVAPLPGEG